MTMRKSLPASLVVLILGFVSAQGDELPPKSGNATFDQAVQVVMDNFYDPAVLPAFAAAVAAEEKILPLESTSFAYDAALDRLVAGLGASHTGHYDASQLDYYELADIFRFNYRQDLRRLFPPEGRITYPGIGIASALLDGKRFVTDVYDGGPAAKAGILVGDEILAADGAPFQEIGSFRDKVGTNVKLEVRRQADAAPITVDVPVVQLQPSDALVEGITDSARITEKNGKKIGYLHIWTFASGDVEGAIDAALTGPLAAADALVVDLRGRWGGAPPDAAEIFLGGTPPFRFIDRSGKGTISNVRWHKPVVALVDDGTRSGQEVFAYALQAKGIPLVGSRTAGALLGARGYMLPDGSLLEIPVAGVELDGRKLEGVGVMPDVSAPFDIRYADGHDPQFDAAMERALAMLRGGEPGAG
jgi:C-terminal processing protease CtpA/Prc